MKPVDRQKICPNCDGRVAYDATQCTYCFTALPVDPSAPKMFTPSTSPESFSNIYTPPYTSKPMEPMEAKIGPKTTPIYAEKDGGALIDKTETSETQAFLPLLSLVLGGNLLTLGILQFFFSDHGRIHLELNGSYWFLMVLVSLPILYYGLKSTSKN